MRIGVFDSGLGGLTVLRELLWHFSDCTFLYFGDTAHLPYGSKSPETILSLTENAVQFLEHQGIDALVIACHTASAWAAPRIRRVLSVPVFDMVTPTLQTVQSSICGGPIGILGTRAMIRSNVYPSALQALGSRQVIAQACPLFVPVIEEGLIHDPVCRSILQAHLEPLRKASVETVVLGCTHYPALLPQLKEELPSCLEWIDPAQAVARALRTHVLVSLESNLVPHTEASAGSHTTSLAERLHCWVTDDPAHFLHMSGAFLGVPVPGVQLVATLDRSGALPSV
jgi:glutamate racemase